jgi:hypothetical protein
MHAPTSSPLQLKSFLGRSKGEGKERKVDRSALRHNKWAYYSHICDDEAKKEAFVSARHVVVLPAGLPDYTVCRKALD